MKKLLFGLLGAVLIFALACTKMEILSSEKQVIEFSIGTLGSNSKGVIDEVAKKIAFEVPAGTDITKLVPIIKTSPGSTISPTSGVAQDFTKEVTYTVTAEDGTKQAYIVSVLPPKSAEKNLLTFKLSGLTPEVVGVINPDKKTVTLTVPFGTDVKALVPTITFSKSAAVAPGSDVKQDFTKPVVYTVTAENGTKQDYTATVEFGKSSDKNITEFRFAALTPAAVATIDQNARAIKVVVPSGTNVKALVATISVSPNAVVDPASGVAKDFSTPVTYNVTAQDGSKVTYTVTVEVAKNTDAKILDFKLAALSPVVSGVIDQSAKTVKLTVPYGTTVTSLVPTVVISDKATITPATGVVKDFTSPAIYKVKSESGVEVSYTVSVEVKKFETIITKVSSTNVSVGGELVITGSFIPGKTKVSLVGTTSADLTIVSESTAEIKVSVPSSVAQGSYTLSVISDGIKASYSQNIVVVDPNAPIITSVNKTSFIRGLDQIVITGKNLKPIGWSSFIVFGENGYAATINTDGTEIRMIVPIEVPVGSTTVKVMVNDQTKLCSNSLPITILANTNPKPVISSVSATSIFVGDVFEIKGTNFATQGNKVKFLVAGFQSGYTATIISESATSIKVATNNLREDEAYDLYVVSNGQEVKYSTPINVALGTLVVASATPTTLKQGQNITLTGKYLYKNSFYIKIDGVNHEYTIDNLGSITVPVTSWEKVGEHTLVVTSTDYSNPKVLFTTKFTVIE